MSTIEIRQFPCRSDNYGILIHDRSTGVTAAVDAPDEQAVRDELRRAGWALTHIFTTHYHFDHVAGHEGLKRETNCTIYGPEKEARDIPCIDIPIEEGEKLTRATEVGIGCVNPTGKLSRTPICGGIRHEAALLLCS